MPRLFTFLLLFVIAFFLARIGLLVETQVSWPAMFTLIGGALGGAAVGLQNLGRRVRVWHVIVAGIVLSLSSHVLAWQLACERFEQVRAEHQTDKPLEAMFVAQQEPPTFEKFMTPLEGRYWPTVGWWGFVAVAQTAIALAVFLVFQSPNTCAGHSSHGEEPVSAATKETK